MEAKTANRTLLVIILLFSVVAIVNKIQFGSEINLEVIDENDKPIQGAIVTVVWKLVKRSYDGNVPSGIAYAYETQTDNKGKVHIPSWGPKFKKIFTYPDNHNYPLITIFKDKYNLKRLHNNKDNIYFNIFSKSRWDNKTVKMERANNMLDYYYWIPYTFYDDYTFINTRPCLQYEVQKLHDAMKSAVMAARIKYKELNIPKWPVDMGEINCD